ncbi:MAG TPA: penicillin-binding protein activator, partial [Roseiarcus sp.]|nr:penicillin-binding protein activator [Roseiarcus sp.]
MSRLTGATLAGFAAVALAGCGPTGGVFDGAPTTPVQSQPLGGPTVGETIGSGPSRIGVILPLTQGSGPSAVGVSLKNAAALALQESGGKDVTLMIVDDRSTPDGAAQAAQSALGAGAELLIGPLYAPNVREVGRIAKAAGKPEIAFSTDATVASAGVYLLSFMIEGYVDRVVEFAQSRGKKSFAALAPQSDFGNVAVTELQRVAGRLGVKIVTVIRYPPGDASSVASQLSAVSNQIDALLIPEQADGMAAVNEVLTTSGVKTQILGTGVWNDARVLRLPSLQGAWFAAPDSAGFNAFADR